MKKFLLFFFFLAITFIGYAQERTVSGTVTSTEDGTTLPGVNVVLKGTSVGTVTDVDGNYSLTVPSDGGILVFSFVGLATKEVSIGASSVINVEMESDVTELSEVVITGGYTDINQQKTVASLSVVNNDVINDVALPDVNQIIQGRAAGVYTTAPSGQPGAAQDIRIRGTGSISAGRGPLYVIDGIIVENGDFTTRTQTNDALSNLNPNDISNVTILKDAAATALYGSRGSNGVVLITTKRGRAGRSSINARVQYGVTLENSGNFEMMDARTQWEYERQLLENSGFTQAQIDARRPQSMLDSTFNWVDAAFRQGKTENYELNAQGGGENGTFYMSAGYFKQDGTLIESAFERMSVRANIDQRLSDKFDAGLNLNVSYTDQLNAVAGNRFSSPLLGAFVNTPLQNPYDPETGELYSGLEPEWMIFTNDNFLYSAPLNPVVNNNLRTIGKLFLNYNVTENIRLTQNLAVDFLSIREKRFFDPTTNDGVDDNGSIDEAYNENVTYTAQSKATGNWLFDGVHNLDALAVFEYQKNNRSSFDATGIGLATGKLKTLNSTATPQGVGGFDTEYAFVSFLGQLNYSFDNRYYLQVSGRRDGSSRFGADNRWANFWSVGASWRMIEESFMQNIGALSDAKLRVSYGTSGNAEIGNFASLGLYGFGPAYLGNPGSSPSQISNPALTWETSRQLDVGIDFGFINNRITGSVDYYRKESEELLLDVPVSATSGFTSATQNIGSILNQGVEVVLSTVNIDKVLRWTTDFNLSRNINEILELNNDEDISNGSQIIRVGEPIRSWYMERWAGVNPADGTPLWLTEEGDLTGSYAQAGRFLVGNAEPDFIAGLNNRLTYKGLSFSFFFYAAVGHEVYNSSRRFIESDGQRYGWNHLVDAGQDYWREPGDIASRPQPLLGGNNASNSRSTRYLENGSFLRLRNVMIAYQIPTPWMTKIGLQGARVYVQGQNLLTITDYTGFDPEMDESGNEFFRYPVGKTITFGLDLSL